MVDGEAEPAVERHGGLVGFVGVEHADVDTPLGHGGQPGDGQGPSEPATVMGGVSTAIT